MPLTFFTEVDSFSPAKNIFILKLGHKIRVPISSLSSEHNHLKGLKNKSRKKDRRKHLANKKGSRPMPWLIKWNPRWEIRSRGSVQWEKGESSVLRSFPTRKDPQAMNIYSSTGSQRQPANLTAAPAWMNYAVREQRPGRPQEWQRHQNKQQRIQGYI